MAITPHSQGDLDGLCGIYSIVNGLNFLFSIRLAPGFSEDVFEIVASAIPRKFYPAVLWDGMDVKLLTLLARKASAVLRAEIGFEIEVTTPFLKKRFKSRDQFLEAAT